MIARSMTSKRLKAIVSVTEMARMVELSRSRFYQLVERGVFLWPLYSLATQRPFYSADMQEQNLSVRETGIGANGEYILFYERRPDGESQTRRPVAAKADSDLLDGLRSLGMADITQRQVDAAMRAIYPQGTAEADSSEVLRTIFRHLRRQKAGA